MARESEFVPLNDAELRAVIGPNSRHVALIEDAFKVLVEAPGGGVSVNGGARDRTDARQVIEDLAKRAALGAEVTEADVRAALGQARGGRGTPGMAAAGVSLPGGKRGAIVPKTKAQAAYLDMLGRCELSFGVGPAGTGKTFLAAAYGASLLRRGQVDRLVITRPAVEAGEKLGFLPGDMKDKVDPYLRPLYDALYDCMPPEQVERRLASGEIEIAPIAFMRGRTLADAFVILDEAQNTTREQMKMFLTRFGQNSRMVVCGDPRQVDIPGGDRMSGLADAVSRLEGVEGIDVTRFTSADVVRHPIVGRIVDAYEGEGA